MGIGSFFSSMLDRQAPDPVEPEVPVPPAPMGAGPVEGPPVIAALPSLFVTVTNVQRADRTVNVEVLFEDADGKFAERRVLNFHDLEDDASGTAVDKVLAELGRMGRQFQTTLDVTETKLSSLIGVKIAL